MPIPNEPLPFDPSSRALDSLTTGRRMGEDVAESGRGRGMVMGERGRPFGDAMTEYPDSDTAGETARRFEDG